LIGSALFLGALAVALVLFGPFHGEPAAGKSNAPGASQPRQPVLAADVMVKPMPVEFSTVGRVEAIKSVALKPRISGVISQVEAVEGQDVTSGQLLFALDDRELQAQLRQSEAALARSQADLDNAQRDMKRTATLVEKNVSARSTLDQQKSTVAGLQAAVREANAAIERAKVQLSYTTIKAPFDGRIGTIHLNLGSAVNATDSMPLVTVNQLKPVYVTFAVPQHYLAELQDALARGEVPVAAASASNPEAVFTGKVTFIENAIDAQTNGLTVKASFPNDQLRLWPGQFLTVTITLRTEPAAIVLPTEALQSDQTGDFVFAIKDDQTVEMRQVKVRWMSGDDAVVEGALKAGDKVVTRGQLRLQQGTPVDIRAPASDDEKGAS